jgi:hypothetical protein
MWGKRVKIFSAILMILCLVLSLNVLPVNANSNQGMMATLAPPLPAPPPGFDPLTATDQQLQKYGFPPRPSNSEDFSHWTYVMSYAKNYVKAVLTPTTQAFSPNIITLGYHDTGYTDKWAGYVIQSAYNNYTTYTQSWADWVQPGIVFNTRPCCWVGLGGYTTSYCVQAGAISNATGIPGATAPIEFAVEDTPYNPVFVSQPAINAGDELYAQVMYGGITSTAFLLNFRTYEYTTVPFWTPYYDNTTAEFIFESMQHMYGGLFYAPFYACAYVGSNGAGNLSNSNYTKVIMTSNGKSNGYVYGLPSSVNNSSFYVTTP